MRGGSAADPCARVRVCSRRHGDGGVHSCIGSGGGHAPQCAAQRGRYATNQSINQQYNHSISRSQNQSISQSNNLTIAQSIKHAHTHPRGLSAGSASARHPLGTVSSGLPSDVYLHAPAHQSCEREKSAALGLRAANKQTNKQRNKQRNKETNKQRNKETNKETKKQTNIQTNKQTKKQTNKQTYTHTHTHTQTNTNKHCTCDTC